ncbi:MAG: hypothetical protein E3J86_10435, partial [Candidatus Thorarchaeota archaeon]
MAQLSSLRSIVSSTHESGSVSKLAGFGNIFGIIAAAVGLFAGVSLVPIPSLSWEQTSVIPFEWVFGGSALFPFFMIGFMALMSVSLMLQYQGSKGLSSKLGSNLAKVFWVSAFAAFVVVAHVWLNFEGVSRFSQISGFLTIIYLLGTLFVITWQIGSVIYTDSSKTWIGFLAGMLNALFIPVLALGQALSPLLIYAAYGILLVGQLMSLLFWWSPFDTIREYARSPSKAKIAFGLTGLLTFVIGLGAVFVGPILTSQGVSIWSPWSTLATLTTFQTNPALVFALLAMMLYWLMLSPRLGARELKAATIGEDIIKGGNKALMLFLVFIGMLAAGQAGAFTEGVGGLGFFMVIAPAGIMFIMGALYTAK